ncbi:MAG: DNA primase small subunit domain-containing protein [Candidatus Diapherotrites archaeon]
MPQPSPEEEFLKNEFKQFYLANEIKSIPQIEQREFGIGAYGKKITKRHMSFSDYSDLNFFLRNEVPLFISSSAAYYKDPSARPMESKLFLGSDLVYEFDVSDINSDCKENHDFWLCEKCGKKYAVLLEACNECQGKLIQYKFPCSKCVNETKKQTLRLLNILRDELGLSSNISVNFSGNAGYHVHIRDKSIRNISAEARLAIVDYITAEGFSFEKSGFNFDDLKCPPIHEAVGLRKRVLDNLTNFILNASYDWLVQYGCVSLTMSQKHAGKNLVAKIIEKRKEVAEQLKRGLFYTIGSNKVASAFWKALAEKAVSEASLPIDRQTSVDIYKIVRVPDTLHGSTGFIAKTIELAKIEDFNPFEHALAFGKRQIKVFISKAPEFKIDGEKFGPFDNEEATLPENAAVYLVAKGVAKIM